MHIRDEHDQQNKALKKWLQDDVGNPNAIGSKVRGGIRSQVPATGPRSSGHGFLGLNEVADAEILPAKDREDFVVLGSLIV